MNAPEALAELRLGRVHVVGGSAFLVVERTRRHVERGTRAGGAVFALEPVAVVTRDARGVRVHVLADEPDDEREGTSLRALLEEARHRLYVGA